MSKTVVLVGHCGADTAYLKLAVRAADPTAAIVSAESDVDLKNALVGGAELVLVNRQVDYGYESDEGVEVIRTFAKAFPTAKMMLISNFPESQTAAVEAGALPGFGKREIGTPKVKSLLQATLASPVTAK